MESTALIQLARDNWPKPLGLAAVWILVAAGESLLASLLPSGVSLAISAMAGFVLTTLWIRARRLKRCPTDRFGFVVAISVDNDATYKLFERDFVHNLEQLLRTGSLRDRVWVYQIPQFHMPRNPTQDEAIELRRKTKAAFVLYGQVRTRQEHVKNHYLDLHGLVSHAETSSLNTQRLSKEFTELLPRRMIAAEGTELPAFELTSSVSSVVAKYIAGIAAFLSGAADYAEAMYSDALALAEPLSKKHEVAQKIVDRVPFRRAELSIYRASRLYNEWKETRADESLREMDLVLDAAPAVAHDLPEFRTLKAISLIATAADDFDKIEQLVGKTDSQDPVTQMNLAFFDIVRGDLRAATKHYRKAAELNVSMETIEEVMSFFEWFQQYRPVFYTQTNFALGFISYCLLQDSALAAEFFANFRRSRNDRFPEENLLIDKWESELRPPWPQTS